MDLNLFFRVVRRYRFLVIFGVLVATALAILSFAKITGSGLAYRQPKQWASHENLLVTQPGFPLGQATLPIGVQAPGNLSTNAVIYATLASSKLVSGIMRSYGGPLGKVDAVAVTNPDGSTLPIVDIAGLATSQGVAKRTADNASKALTQYVVNEQENAKPPIPPSNRIILNSLGAPDTPQLIKSPSKTRPIFVFLAVLMAFIGLAFILENLRPAVRVQERQQDRDRDDDAVSRQVSKPPLRASDRPG